jgi:flagellar basal-body rod protein FlgB
MARYLLDHPRKDAEGRSVNFKSDPLLGNHAQALQIWQQRAELLSSNLANADTPDYLARDVDFRKALSDATSQGNGEGNGDGPLQMAATQSGHIGGNNASTAGANALAYRVPIQPSMDGNTVDTQVEQAQFASNAVHYQASLAFITSSIHTMKTAITGTSS